MAPRYLRDVLEEYARHHPSSLGVVLDAYDLAAFDGVAMHRLELKERESLRCHYLSILRVAAELARKQRKQDAALVPGWEIHRDDHDSFRLRCVRLEPRQAALASA